MKNRDIADIFARIADLMEILGVDRFRVNSYRKVARILGELSEDLAQVAAEDRLEGLAGVGKSSAAKIRQFLADGKIDVLDELLAQVPEGLPDLLSVGGLGPKTIAKLWKQADVTSVDELQAAVTDDPGKLESVEGLGAKKVAQLAESLQFMAASAGRVLLSEAEAAAGPLLELVAACKGAKHVRTAGSLRRQRETIGDVDILCEATKAIGAKIIETFTAAEGVQRVLAAGETKGSVLLDGGIQADLRVVGSAAYGAAMAYFTGSKAHNVRLRERAIKMGLKLNEYGLYKGARRVAGKTEASIYEALKLAFVPPELREDRGEVEAAAEDALPKLIDPANIRGDLHMHTTASDGANSIEEMIRACRDRGYKYLAITDHSKSQVQARGLDEKRLAAHIAAIRKAAATFPDMLVLTGIEVDVFKDGTLDFEADVLAELDFVTASPHSALAQDRAGATKRLIRAIEHPHVRCIGHASGRLINMRPGMEIDIEKIAAAAAANDVAMEINSHPMRLDLRDTHVRAAIEAGAKLAINTDAHSCEQLDMMQYGVSTARRGWATAGDVVNTFTPARLMKWLER
jgi:DNA polymerase (family X)